MDGLWRDSELQRQLIAEVDYSMGIADILHAGDGFDAIALVKANPQIEAVILDLEMPGMDGVQVLCELATLNLAVPVVLASLRRFAVAALRARFSEHWTPALELTEQEVFLGAAREGVRGLFCRGQVCPDTKIGVLSGDSRAKTEAGR
jgi:CheY-like chemotaxis protein